MSLPLPSALHKENGLLITKRPGKSSCSPLHWQGLSVHSGTSYRISLHHSQWARKRGRKCRAGYCILHVQTLLFKISPQIFHTFRCRELLMKWTQGYGGWEGDGCKVLQNGEEFSNGNNFKVIDVETVVVLAHLVPTAPRWQTTASSAAPSTTGAVFLVEDCMH